MSDLKKRLKSSKSKTTETNNEMFTENPFFIAIIVFVAAIFINYLLELEFTKSMFKWGEYYFNSSLFWLNSNLQPAFKDHPYIRIPVFTNPVTAEFMTIINPWMWLRGFIISSFAASQIITILQIKIIKSKNVVIASILIGILQLGMYASSYGAALSVPLFVALVQKFYINIFALIFICLVGLLSGVEYAVYLLRNDKIHMSSKKENDGPKINVQVVDKLDW
ncbi:MAG: hypothetical protein A2039_04195 [Candidatus Melainabacteria bacterium GWA2_34_9]|nr:MAG: hypothetical protein A2039_04195 [Candidatus Melainabacteria bacterium GWA2_34_9]